MAEPPAYHSTATTTSGVETADFDEEAEDWFGEGSSFDTGEDLAAALFAMAGAPAPAVEEMTPVEESGAEFAPAILSVDTASFKVVEPAPRAPSPNWTVRAPGAAAPREGTNRWGIRHGVQILKRTEQTMARLQRDAVEVTFAAAAAACAQALPERRRGKVRRAA